MLSWMVPDQPDAAFKLEIWAKALPAGNAISQMAIASRSLSMIYLLQISLSSPLAYYDRALSWTLAEVLCYPVRQWFTLVCPYINTPTSTKDLHNSYMTALQSVEARICATSSNPNLCLQVQQMAVVARKNTPRIFKLPQARPT